MKVYWRYTASTRNTYAALFAACEQEGFPMEPVSQPSQHVTCYSLNSLNVQTLRPEMARADCIVIAGGPHATACWRDVLSYADYVIVGEGEYTLPALLASIEAGDPVCPAGVATHDGLVPSTSTVLLDSYPAFSMMKGYVEISRGCPFSCTYCQTPSIFGHAMRHRSIENIVRFASRYRDARFVSPNALAYGSDGRHVRLDKIRALLSALSNNIYFGTFPSEVRPEFVTEDALSLITRYCANSGIHFGAQSGSDRVLRTIRRGHTVEDVIRAVELTNDAGLKPVVDIIVGFPFETEEDQKATAELARWITRFGTIHAHSFLPLPGTPLAGLKPRPLTHEFSTLLGSLARQGKLTGSWQSREIGFSHPISNL
jgi:B12-binding domain/radical SAM domain protein